MENVLVLVRHGQSEWNAKNLFTGWKDVDLTEAGIAEARRAGKLLARDGVQFDLAFTSKLMRAQKTLTLILKELGQTDLETHEDLALNERDYGDLSGLNKAETAEKYGADQVHIWRRSYDIPPPGGESLKDTAERTLPYFDSEIMPRVMDGKNVIVAAHGNSLRAIVMKLEGLSSEEIVKREIATGAPIIYRFNSDGSVAGRSELEESAA